MAFNQTRVEKHLWIRSLRDSLSFQSSGLIWGLAQPDGDGFRRPGPPSNYADLFLHDLDGYLPDEEFQENDLVDIFWGSRSSETMSSRILSDPSFLLVQGQRLVTRMVQLEKPLPITTYFSQAVESLDLWSSTNQTFFAPSKNSASRNASSLMMGHTPSVNMKTTEIGAFDFQAVSTQSDPNNLYSQPPYTARLALKGSNSNNSGGDPISRRGNCLGVVRPRGRRSLNFGVHSVACIATTWSSSLCPNYYVNSMGTYSRKPSRGD
ncbi:hypothetical protein B0T10DRAFT_458338 [Thelonectria olida]|uniref:Uncharacterized protein n=1 Tax=Thelonectria olida TaxID=1576542 RepID=A0A9P8WBT8_9HYPO|nr:hypothetical protein B0T10DRAFT_458338 [Thelonectria olida]